MKPRPILLGILGAALILVIAAMVPPPAPMFPPGTPTLVLPSNGAISQPTSGGLLIWITVPTALTYNLQIGPTSTFPFSGATLISGIASPSYIYTGLLN